MPDDTPADHIPASDLSAGETSHPDTCSPPSPAPSHSLRDLPVIRMSDLYRGDHTGQLFRVELNSLEDMMMYLEYLKPSANEPGLMEIANPQEIAEGADVPKAITPAQLKKSLLVQGGAIIDQKLAARETHLLQSIRTLETTLRDTWTEQHNALETRVNDGMTRTSAQLHTALREKAEHLEETLQERTTALQTALDDTTRDVTEATSTLTKRLDEDFPALRNEVYDSIQSHTNTLEERLKKALQDSTNPLAERTAALEETLNVDLPALETELRSAVHDSESRIRRSLTDTTETLEQRLTNSVNGQAEQAEARISTLDKKLLAKVNTGLATMKVRYDSKAQALRQDIDDQLLTLRAQVRSPLVASETRKGIIQLATQSEVNDGRNNDNAVTPQTLAQTLACHRSQISAEIDSVQRSIPHVPTFPARANGYQLLPSGLLIQWGSLSSNRASARRVQFPVSFSYACYALSCTSCHTIPQPVSVDNVSIHGFKIYGDGNYWIAIGC